MKHLIRVAWGGIYLLYSSVAGGADGIGAGGGGEGCWASVLRLAVHCSPCPMTDPSCRAAGSEPLRAMGEGGPMRDASGFAARRSFVVVVEGKVA